MKAVITVLGKDRVGIIYQVTKILFENNVNIEDISQTIIQDYFTMVMMVSLPASLGVETLRSALSALSEENLLVQVQKTEIFDVMHRL